MNNLFSELEATLLVARAQIAAGQQAKAQQSLVLADRQLMAIQWELSKKDRVVA